MRHSRYHLINKIPSPPQLLFLIPRLLAGALLNIEILVLAWLWLVEQCRWKAKTKVITQNFFLSQKAMEAWVQLWVCRQ